MQILLIEPAIVIDAVLPSLLFEAEIIVEDVLTRSHLALDPLRLVVTALGEKVSTLG